MNLKQAKEGGIFLEEKDKNRSRDEALEKIEYYIIENKLPAHTKIPSERDLSELWGFNRTTLRAAIKRLIVEGKLYQKKGSGTYIAVPKLIRNLRDLRALSIIVWENGQTLSNKVLSVDVIESNKQITKKLQLPLGHKVYALSRLRFIDGEPATIENSFLDYNKFPNFIEHDFNIESLYSVIEKDYNIKLASGEEQIGIAYATADEAQRLGILEGQAVFYLSGVVYNDNAEPIEYFKSVVRSDMMRFASELRDY